MSDVREIVETVLDRLDEVLYEELAGLDEDTQARVRKILSRYKVIYE